MLIAGVLILMAVLAAVVPGRRSQGRRLEGIQPSRPAPRRTSRRVGLAIASGIAGLVGFGLPLGVVVGGVAAVGIVVTGRGGGRDLAVAEDVAVAAELLAGCLAAGLAMADALDAVAVVGDPVTAGACHATAASLRRGDPAAQAWQPWQVDPWLSPIGRTAQRSTQTGAAAADELQRAAARLRARRRARLQHRVQRAAVWVVVPLGLCFLPAFVLVAVVPLVAGLFGSLH
jgi:pilus assembly protein TadC